MDPLAQLSDIHLPANVHGYPIAPGWWLLAVIVLALIIYGLLKLRRVMIKRQAKKMALKQLSTATDISAMVALLKWAALQYFPRSQVAHLTGHAFKSFLIATLPAKHQQKFTELSAEHFVSVYQDVAASTTANKISSEFSSATKLWLSQALPPKKDLARLAPTITKNTNTALHNSPAADKSANVVIENDGEKS
ncbi:MAG: ABC-type transport system involved in Fe-S cluster assembly fused permease/ATPase subunit [Cognaticolwellia sp.]|jgi:ABC-type transport system involved in Fe-S cluster assembly fused permease/ATPase subunit